MSDGTVVAAWIGAGTAISLATVDLVDRFSGERRGREVQMFLAALEYFQGSQRRSVGIAALAILRSRRRTWRQYQGTIRELYYRQLLYLYSHGSNRWQAHEISNMEVMTEWLLNDALLGPLHSGMKEQLLVVMKPYRDQVYDSLDAETRKGGNKDSVTHLQERIRREWESKLR